MKAKARGSFHNEGRHLNKKKLQSSQLRGLLVLV